MLLQRVVTALCLLVLILGVLFWGSQTAWVVLTLPVLGIVLWEWSRLLVRSAVLPILIGTGAAFAYHLLRAQGVPPMGLLPVLGTGTLVWLAVAVPSVLCASPAGPASSVWLACLFMFNLWVALYELRLSGPWILLSAMAIVWLADIGAYFAGRALGRHKLAPRVSPGKTWEGVVGGMAVVIGAALLVWVSSEGDGTAIFSSMLAGHFGVFGMIGALIVLVMISVLGDLFESLLKRHAGVKDSSNILPGHGGVFDRIDALVPSMPLCLLLLMLMLP
ncbi:MAG: phosphatidate cytidylyltransferase [Lautropia sp.]|nr:phosphatidate cytidylyltransferase [Lautropia sp.]